MRPTTKTAGGLQSSGLPLAFALIAALLASCSGSAQLGDSCQESADCVDALQCFGGQCTPTCSVPADCGDGHLCDDGECSEVISNVGDLCERELDCGVNQTCKLDDADLDGDGWLSATCAAQGPGGVLGAVCNADTDCRSSSCNIGRCTELCVAVSDCQGAMTCTEIPRLLPASAAMFRGCLAANGVLAHTLEVPGPLEDVRLPVPGNARAITITSHVSDDALLTGVYAFSAPSGAVLYQDFQTLEQFLANPVRYSLARRESTLLFPNRPEHALVAGAYKARFGAEFQNRVLAQEVPEVTVHYKLDDSAILDLNVYFLDLADHPCADSIGNGDTLTAETAPNHVDFQLLVARLSTIFTAAGIEMGTIRYSNISSRPEFDALDADDIDDLLTLGDATVGLSLFVVRSVEPGGIQVLAGGSPAAPRIAHASTAGVALSMDTLCYRDWRDAGRMVAHAFGRQMGLFRNREPSSTIVDPISDSSVGDENLMFFGEFGGIELSSGQATVLSRYPGLR